MRLGAYALTLALVSGAVQAQAPDLLGWLRKMHEATQKLSYSGTFIYQNGSRSETSSPTWRSLRARPRGDAREIWPASMSIISASTRV